MTKNLNADSEGIAQGGNLHNEDINPNLEEDNRDLEDETSSDDTEESLRQEKLAAISQAIKNDKEAKKQRADSEFYRTAHQVLKDPNQIVSIYENNPQLADRISQENWGMTYAQLLEYSRQENDTKQPAYDRRAIETIVKETLQSSSKDSEAQEIERFVPAYLLDKGIDTNNPKFKEILRDFEEFQPDTLPKAKKILKMLVAAAKDDDTDEGSSLNNVYTPRKGSAVREKPSNNGRKVSPFMRQYMEETYGRDGVQKFLSGK